MDRDKISNLYRGPSIDASYQVSVHLGKEFQRRRLKCETLTDDGRQVMAKVHLAKNGYQTTRPADKSARKRGLLGPSIIIVVLGWFFFIKSTEIIKMCATSFQGF
jgi:hypothetical protein